MFASRKIKKPVALDMFCGVGGLTYGLQLAGIDVVGGYDVDASCKYAFEKNNGVPFYLKDVSTLKPCELPSLWRDSEIRILAGCAPCQPFSTYSRTRRGGDDRWSLLKHFSSIVINTVPQVVTMENVPQLVHHRVFHEFVNILEEMGYYVWWSTVQCENIGIPQTRKRLVLLASLVAPTKLDIGNEKAVRTVADAINTLPRLESGQESLSDSLHRSCKLSSVNFERIRASTPGGTWREWPNRLKAKCHTRKSGSTYPSVYGRMEWNKPAPTITTQYFGYGNGRFGHPDQDRAISLREGAILQTFPNDYQFEPPGERLPTNCIGRMIGNAVPPLLGRAIGVAIYRHLNS